MGRHYQERRLQNKQKNKEVKRMREAKWMTALTHELLCDQDDDSSDGDNRFLTGTNGQKAHVFPSTKTPFDAGRLIDANFDTSVCKRRPPFETALLDGPCKPGDKFTYTAYGSSPVEPQRYSTILTTVASSSKQLKLNNTSDASKQIHTATGSELHSEINAQGSSILENRQSSLHTKAASPLTNFTYDLAASSLVDRIFQCHRSIDEVPRYTLRFAEARLVEIERFQGGNYTTNDADLVRAIDIELARLRRDFVFYRKESEYEQEKLYIDATVEPQQPNLDFQEDASDGGGSLHLASAVSSDSVRGYLQSTL